MKIFFFFIFMVWGPFLLAAPFGSLIEPDERGTQYYKDSYIIDKIADGKTISVCVDGRLDKYSLSARQLDAALNSWFKYAHTSIVSSGRQEEFKDLMPLLLKRDKVRMQNCSDDSFFKKDFKKRLAEPITLASEADGYDYTSSREDLRIILVDSTDISDGRSYFNEGGENSAPYIVWAANNLRGSDGLNVLRHELGHALSLSDQYQESRLNSGIAYGTSDYMPSMMREGKNFTCDDADALIFTLDCIAQKNTSRGGEEGWKSFCPQRAGRSYAYCKTKKRGDVLWVDDTTVRYVRYNLDGSVAMHKEWNRMDNSRFFSLYPLGIPPVPSNFYQIHEGKYVSYKLTDEGAEYLFNTRLERDGNFSPNQEMVVLAEQDQSLVVIKEKDSISFETKNDNSAVFIEKKGKNIWFNAGSEREGDSYLSVQFVYTPQARFERYEIWDKKSDQAVILMFLRDFPVFYVFFSEDALFRFYTVNGAVFNLPELKDGYPVFNDTSIPQKVISDLINHLKQRDEICQFDSSKPVYSSFLYQNSFGQDVWALHVEWTKYVENTMQNWMPESLDNGFRRLAPGSTASRQQTRAQVQKSLTQQLRKK